ncbi:hypothetical protein [Flavobacterium sp. CSZ]|uniref:hypothetical protein n=1 Tax=Flavobacterium sp. CSZ TaxID=2783791 RepID=UPI00188DA5B4|nr:hypothetical protein [Flavobacterium sp. CSZ]MBF4485037.1 hypothetical protein [Flavobacterium sp. CSZ]
MKWYLIFVFLGFVSCVQHSLSNEEHNINYSIKYKKYHSSFNIYLKSNNDTLYIEKYKKSNFKKVKICVDHKTNLEIKKYIEDNLNTKYLAFNQIKITHGNSISFDIDNGTNSLKATYSDIGNYWSISNEFGNLIENLKKDYIEFKDF